MYGKPLEELPIKIFDKRLSEEVVKISKRLIEKFSDMDFEELNKTIYRLYNLSAKEVEVVEDFYSKIKFT